MLVARAAAWCGALPAFTPMGRVRVHVAYTCLCAAIAVPVVLAELSAAVAYAVWHGLLFTTSTPANLATPATRWAGWMAFHACAVLASSATLPFLHLPLDRPRMLTGLLLACPVLEVGWLLYGAYLWVQDSWSRTVCGEVVVMAGWTALAVGWAMVFAGRLGTDDVARTRDRGRVVDRVNDLDLDLQAIRGATAAHASLVASCLDAVVRLASREGAKVRLEAADDADTTPGPSSNSTPPRAQLQIVCGQGNVSGPLIVTMRVPPGLDVAQALANLSMTSLRAFDATVENQSSSPDASETLCVFAEWLLPTDEK